MAALRPLPEDVEIDGETCNTSDRLRHQFANYRSDLGKDVECEQRQESGFVSMSPGCSLESGSLKQEEAAREEKLSVECSESEGTPGTVKDSVEDLGEKIGNINLEEDEGIEILKSIDSIASDASDILEVDLFDQDLDGDTLIHMAIVGNAPKVASVLIDMADDIGCLNLQNDLYQTSLHLAVITENYDIAIQLVRKGADVKLCDKQGNTALHLACKNGDKDVIRALLETFGENKNARQKYFAMKNCAGLTCLHLAAEQKHFLVMGYLFAKGADVNMGDAKSGRTILHYAVEKKDVDSVVLLLTHPNIKVDCKTFKGETPLVLAYWRNYQDIVKKLKSKGAHFSYDLFEESDDESS